MKLKKLFFGENSLTKIVEVCDTQEEAIALAKKIEQDTDLSKAQIKILSPLEYDANHTDFIGLKMQPESAGIFTTIMRTHIVFGAVGALLGVFFYTLMMNNILISSTPIQSFVAIVGFSITFAMLFAGLVSMRPDHVGVIAKVKEYLEQKKWIVVMHPLNSHQTQETLEHVDDNKTIKTL